MNRYKPFKLVVAFTTEFYSVFFTFPVKSFGENVVAGHRFDLATLGTNLFSHVMKNFIYTSINQEIVKNLN